ncbi:hypothetical protein [Aridibaculum aurantiacum]|uniref:hypothetical protein n=1 Tax=Aridibaculum aurantiacum TaxID=2810307 RepID=UPI001A9568D3|nr:hypothetical protein [Aridibaculum aurantiacum]
MKLLLIYFSFLVVICTGCNGIPEKMLPSFEVNIQPIKLRVPPIPLVAGEEIPVGALRSPINLDSAIKANTGNTFGANAVHSIKVKHLVLKATNADDKTNLSNFESARIRIYSDTSEVDIAHFTFPTEATDSMFVVPETSPEISQYLKGRSLSYNLFWKNRKPTQKPLQLQVRIALNVK